MIFDGEISGLGEVRSKLSNGLRSRHNDSVFLIAIANGLLSHDRVDHLWGSSLLSGLKVHGCTVWYEAEFQADWHGILPPENKKTTFSAADELLQGKPVETDSYLAVKLQLLPKLLQFP